jgi:ribosomal protein L7Ae-like RNA K-turn-binding protein
MDLIGLGVRAGSVVVGTNGVRAAMQRGELALVVVAGDLSARTDDKIVRLANGLGVPLASGPASDRLGRAVGRDRVQTIGIKDRRLAAAIRSRLTRDGAVGGLA